MSGTIADALRIWLLTTFRPGKALRELRSEPRKVAIAFWINLLFALLYAITAMIYHAIGRFPAVEPWMPVPPERYYLYQVFWTIPWGLTTWIAFSGIAHLLAVAGRPALPDTSFEDALAVCGVAWVVPSTVLMWIPETLLVPFFGAFWPAWVETLRLMILPVAWQIGLVAMGLRETHRVGWLRGVGIGIITVLVFFVSFLAYMR